MIKKEDLKKYENTKVWICHTNWEKRIIKPQSVILGHVPSGYYLHGLELFKINKNGSKSKSKIAYYNRGRQGMGETTPLSIFENECDCKLYFEEKCDEQIKYYTNLKKI